MRLLELVSYLDQLLRVREIPDAAEALNGLQLENSGEVTKIAAAVDLCEATIIMATHERADLLMVHHGMFWGGSGPVVGPRHQRLRGLLDADIAVYSAHLPLDLHADVGNNIELARALGVNVRGEFGVTHGIAIGCWGEVALPRAAFEDALAKALGGPARALRFGPDEVRRVGVVTGAAGTMIGDAAGAGLDTFVTGEGPHWTYFDAEELGLNVYYGGHYRTETFGVKALAAHVATRFSIPWVFLDHPTGL